MSTLFLKDDKVLENLCEQRNYFFQEQKLAQLLKKRGVYSKGWVVIYRRHLGKPAR